MSDIGKNQLQDPLLAGEPVHQNSEASIADTSQKPQEKPREVDRKGGLNTSQRLNTSQSSSRKSTMLTARSVLLRRSELSRTGN